MASKIPVLIVTGYGLNCEAESKYAWELAGGSPNLVHFNDLLETPTRLLDYAALMFIGGFSYGDHMTGGHVMALRFRHRMSGEIAAFIEKGRLILGVCNGFQIMVKLGLLPGLDRQYLDQKLALMQNDCGFFQNYWATLRFEPQSRCVFTRGLGTMPLPVRHGEGKIFSLDRDLIDRLEAEGCVACRYVDPATGAAATRFPHNPNGSVHSIAGLCDPTGRIFGLMPHPEAYLYPENHPHWDSQKLSGSQPPQGLGLQIFQNAIDFLRQ